MIYNIGFVASLVLGYAAVGALLAIRPSWMLGITHFPHTYANRPDAVLGLAVIGLLVAATFLSMVWPLALPGLLVTGLGYLIGKCFRR